MALSSRGDDTSLSCGRSTYSRRHCFRTDFSGQDLSWDVSRVVKHSIREGRAPHHRILKPRGERR